MRRNPKSGRPLGHQNPKSMGLVVLLLAATGLALPWRSAGTANATAPVVRLYGSAPDAPDSQLQAIIQDVVGNLPDTWGVAVKKLDTGQYAVYNGDKQQVSASLYKLWVLEDLYYQVRQGNLNLDDYATVTSDDTYFDATQGNITIDAGNSLTYRRAAYLMITLSDNTAAALLVRNLGPDNINNFMQQNGFTHSLLDWSGVGDNLTTPLDQLRQLEMMATAQMVDADASAEMVDTMLDQQINDRLPVGLPDGTRIAHKTGDLDNLLHDVGVVYGPTGPFIIVVMSSNLNYYTDALNAMPELARRVYDYFNSKPTSPARYFPETRQAIGHDFFKFWNEYGGLDTFGLPIGPEQMQGNLLVQPFERARFELHPELANVGRPNPTVALGLIGQERANQLGLSWPRSPNIGEGKYFDGTGQQLTGDFLYYWQNNGGERAFGWPISPAANMVNPVDGKTYLTQWFQRARMEFHPELQVGHRIALGTLGTELAAQH